MVEFQKQEIGHFSSGPHKKYFNSTRKIINLLKSMGGTPRKSFIKHFTYHQLPAQQQMNKYATSFQYICLPFMNFYPSLSISVHISNFCLLLLVFVQIYQSLSTLLILFCKFLLCRYDCGLFVWENIRTIVWGGKLLAVIPSEKSMKAYHVELCVKLLVEGKMIKKTNPIALYSFTLNDTSHKGVFPNHKILCDFKIIFYCLYKYKLELTYLCCIKYTDYKRKVDTLLKQLDRVLKNMYCYMRK